MHSHIRTFLAHFSHNPAIQRPFRPSASAGAELCPNPHPLRKNMKPSFAFITAALALSVSAAASAQTFPTKPLALVVPFSPGGATDVLARMLTEPLNKSF